MEGVRAEALGQTKLALDDLVNQLYAGQDPPSVEETLESEHRAHAAFYPPVILFGRRCSGRDSFESGRDRPNDNGIHYSCPCGAKRRGWARSHPG